MLLVGVCCTRYFLFLSGFRAYTNHSAKFDSNLLNIYPLAPNVPICLPSSLRTTRDTRYRLSFPENGPQFVSSVSKPKRRAEYASQSVRSCSDMHQFLKAHTSRRSIQVAMYRFALDICLNLSSLTDTNEYHPTLLLDIGCGNETTGPLPLSDALPEFSLSSVGIDLFIHGPPKLVLQTNTMDGRIHCVTCDMMRPRSSGQQSLTPFRDHMFDYIISISFLQWLIARDNGNVLSPDSAGSSIDWFVTELARLLVQPGPRSRGGQCVLQFYPSSWTDVDRVCHRFATITPNLTGCRIHARPVQNRGVKLFLYVTNQVEA